MLLQDCLGEDRGCFRQQGKAYETEGGVTCRVNVGGGGPDKETRFKLNSVNVAARLSSRVAVGTKRGWKVGEC